MNDRNLPPHLRPEFWIGLASAMVLAAMTLAAATPEDPSPHVHMPAWAYGVLFVLGAGLQFLGTYYGGPLKPAAPSTPTTRGEAVARAVAALRDALPEEVAGWARALAPVEQAHLAAVGRALQALVSGTGPTRDDPPPKNATTDG